MGKAIDAIPNNKPKKYWDSLFDIITNWNCFVLCFVNQNAHGPEKIGLHQFYFSRYYNLASSVQTFDTELGTTDM